MANYNKFSTSSTRFYGRTQELARLQEAFHSDESQLWVVYGRRRVGKPLLLRQFAKDKGPFFFTGGKEASRTQIRRFLSELADWTGQAWLRKIRSATWSEAFSLLDQQLATRPGKSLLILDELQWMCRGEVSVLSDLQRLWDHRWKDSGSVHLILCGSATGFMVGEVLAQKSPLFGRRTETLHLAPLTAAEARMFLKGRGLFEAAEALICVGGIPAYLERFGGSRSVRKVLDALAFRRDGYLVDEVNLVLGEQLREKERYYQIVELLAASPSSMADLSRTTGLNKGQLSFYLDRLLALEFIDKHRPITKPATSKTVRYRLRDEYLRFYFRFVAPNLGKIQLKRSGYHFDQFTRDRWDTFLGLGFELMASRNLEALLQALGASDVFSRVGSYWHAGTSRKAGVQIDVVVERDDNVTNIIECKWSRKQIGSGVMKELSRKCSLYPNPKQHTLEPVLVAAAGAAHGVAEAGVTTITLEDLFASDEAGDGR